MPRLRTTPLMTTSAPGATVRRESVIEYRRSTVPTSISTVSEQLFSVSVSPVTDDTHAR